MGSIEQSREDADPRPALSCRTMFCLPSQQVMCDEG